MKFLRHCIPQFKALPPRAESTTKPFTTDAYRHTSGFITVTGLLASLVALLLLVSVVMLASQMWQDTFRSSENAGNSRVSTLEVTKNIQPQNTLQRLDENIKKTAVVTTDASNVKVEAAVIDKQIPEPQFDTTTDPTISAVKKPSAPAFKGDPAIYNQTISGRVLTNSGEHVIGAKITAYLIPALDEASLKSDSGRIQSEYSAVSTSQGEFQFDQLPKGQFRLSIEPGKNHGSTNLQVNSGASHVDMIVNKVRQVLVEVRVSDEFAYPLEQVKATVEPGLASDISDVDGWLNFQFDIEEERHYRIRFEAEGYADDTLVLLPSDLKANTQTAVRLEKILKQYLKHFDANLAGTVKGEDGTSVAGARIVIKTPAGVTKFSGMTDTRGDFSFDSMPVNQTYRMYIQPKQAFASKIVELSNLIVGPQYLDIRLQRLVLESSLAGRIIDSGGSPVPDYPFELRSKSNGHLLAVRSNSEGAFHVESLPAGEMSLRTNSQPRTVLQNIVLKANQLTRITLPIDLGDEGVAGQVVNSSGQPVPGASVTLLWGAPVTELSTTAKTRHVSRTDNQGNFRFANLGQGERYMSVTARGYLTSNTTVSIPGTDKILKIKLERIKT